MKPLEEKMLYLRKLAAQVKEAHPGQAAAIDRKLAELQKMWEELRREAEARRRLLEETQGQQIFQVCTCIQCCCIGVQCSIGVQREFIDAILCVITAHRGRECPSFCDQYQIAAVFPIFIVINFFPWGTFLHT